jgi:hypothetical protein
LLAKLDPWLHERWERFANEPDEAASHALEVKIDQVMTALANTMSEDDEKREDGRARASAPPDP